MSRRPILFNSGIPSNFYYATIVVVNPITLAPEEFPTNEHYFHACKAAHALHGTKKQFSEIRKAPDPRAAKRLGRAIHFTTNDRIQWDMYVAPIVMLRANLAKFFQNKECQEWLRTTGTRTLIEHRKDAIWGDNLDGTGKNLLGKILMLVRSHMLGV